jgi:hypothetical protein
MKPPAAFLAGLSILPLAAIILWAITRRESGWSCLPSQIDAEAVRRARKAQDAIVRAGRLSGAGYLGEDVVH